MAKKASFATKTVFDSIKMVYKMVFKYCYDIWNYINI